MDAAYPLRTNVRTADLAETKSSVQRIDLAFQKKKILKFVSNSATRVLTTAQVEQRVPE